MSRKWIYPGVMTLAFTPGLTIRAAPEAGFNLEALASDDIKLIESAAYLHFSEGNYETVLSYQHSVYGIDYRPPANAPIGQANEREASKDALHFATQGPAGEDLEWLVEGGGYIGSSDYKSLWVAEYYRQLFKDYAGYREHRPMGLNYLLGLRWDYLPSSAFMKISVFGGHDRVSPRWDPILGQGLSSSRTSVDSIGGRIELENVLTRRFRTHNRLTVIENSDRSPRWSFESLNNYALLDSWVLKGTVGSALESPDYHAFWTTATVEWDYRQTWFVGLNARFYQDSGETNELTHYGINAPPATTFGVSAAVRWISGANQASLGVGPYWTRYDPESGDSSPVSVLYSDRAWLWLQAAWSYQF